MAFEARWRQIVAQDQAARHPPPHRGTPPAPGRCRVRGFERLLDPDRHPVPARDRRRHVGRRPPPRRDHHRVPGPRRPRWKRYGNANEAKLEGPAGRCRAGHPTADRRCSDQLTPVLCDGFGIPDLTMETIGGGLPPHPARRSPAGPTPTSPAPRHAALPAAQPARASSTGLGAERPAACSSSTATTGSSRSPPSTTGPGRVRDQPTSWHGHPHPAGRWRFSRGRLLLLA